MHYSFFLGIFLLIFANPVLSQIDTSNLDQNIQNELIFLRIEDVTLDVIAVEYNNNYTPTGRSFLQDRIRNVNVKFTKGTNSQEQTMDRSGENLRKLIEHDTVALKELNRALEFQKQARNSRIIWKSMQFVTVGALFTGLLLSIINNELTTTSKVFLITGGASYATLGVFYFRSKIKFDKFIESIQNCINIYNKNVIAEFE